MYERVSQSAALLTLESKRNCLSPVHSLLCWYEMECLVQWEVP